MSGECDLECVVIYIGIFPNKWGSAKKFGDFEIQMAGKCLTRRQ